MIDVLCLRPREDFDRAGVAPPPHLAIEYRAPADPDVAALMKQARALVIPAVGPQLPASLFDDTSVTFVQVTGAGLDRLDLPLLSRLGIAIANVPGGSNSAVAEYVVTAASLLVRQFAIADALIKDGQYEAVRRQIISANLQGLDGLLAGIIGFGTIGTAVGAALAARGCRICCHDPLPASAAAADAFGAERLPLDVLLQRADLVTLHVPLLPETTNLIGARELGLMKRGAVLIQASRGGIVDERALADRLEAGALRGAAVDVYAVEPPPPDHPLLTLSADARRRLLLTPHIAGVTRQAAAFLFRVAWENVDRALAGLPRDADTVRR